MTRVPSAGSGAEKQPATQSSGCSSAAAVAAPAVALLALGLSRLPGDVWWYSQVHRPNDAERETFQSHEPSHKFKERVDRFRHWLMSREDKVFVVFGHSTFFKELTGGHKSMKNCEVFSYHL